jgi:hypothetical protein
MVHFREGSWWGKAHSRSLGFARDDKGEGSAYLSTGYSGWRELNLVVDVAKAMVGFARIFRPRYALANLGHPSYSSDLAMT